MKPNIMKSIITKKLNAGRFEINLFENNQFVKSFETNDMQLVDDIQEMNDDGFESELQMFESFDAIINYCFNL